MCKVPSRSDTEKPTKLHLTQSTLRQGVYHIVIFLEKKKYRSRRVNDRGSKTNHDQVLFRIQNPCPVAIFSPVPSRIRKHFVCYCDLQVGGTFAIISDPLCNFRWYSSGVTFFFSHTGFGKFQMVLST